MPSEAHERMVQEVLPRLQGGPGADIGDLRRAFEELTADFELPPGLLREATQVGGVPGEWLRTPESREEHILLYLHGGGYAIGSLATYRELVSRLAKATRMRALSLNYRLAPEHPFPAAVQDATAAYRALIAGGAMPEHIAVAGDSAGGGLTLALLLALRDAGEPLPAAAVCLSPWTDLECTGASADSADDPLLSKEGVVAMGQLYAGGDLRNPLAAPLHGDLRGLPPLLILAGTREVLLDDATRFAERARAAGVEAELDVREGLTHVWPLFGPCLPESRETVAQISRFLENRLQSRK